MVAKSILHLEPDGLYASAKLGFTQVVVADSVRTIYVSGQVGCDERGRVVGDSILSQAAQALENIRLALASAGASPADITMMRVFIVDYERDVAKLLNEEFAKFFLDVLPPASTWVGVSTLMHPDFKIEIEAVAAVC